MSHLSEFKLKWKLQQMEKNFKKPTSRGTVFMVLVRRKLVPLSFNSCERWSVSPSVYQQERHSLKLEMSDISFLKLINNSPIENKGNQDCVVGLDR